MIRTEICVAVAFMKILNGNILAEKKLDDVAQRARRVEQRLGRRPSVAVVLVGDDAPSHLYVKLKQKAAQSVGVDFHVYTFARDEDPAAVAQAVTFLAADDDVDAMIIQMPLPEGFDADALIRLMGQAKDADGFHPDNEVAFLAGERVIAPVFPTALMALVTEAGGGDGMRAALVVRSEKFGRILAQTCREHDIVPTIILEDRVPCMQAAILGSDIVISACGTPGLLTSKYIKNNAIVIDGGIAQRAGKTVGDVDRASLAKDKKKVSLSPVPGGVGPMTIAYLLDNVVTLAQKRVQ